MADKKPLWRIAEEAWWGKVDTDSMDDPLIAPPENEQWADVFRALADEAAPEEPEPSLTDSWMARLEWERWAQRKATRALLLKAADEAEGRWQ
jgi:hypothetical protein